MLRKLLKHEFKALSKTIVLIIVLVLATSIASALLTRLTSGIFSNGNIGSSFISGIFFLIAGIGVIALVSISFIAMILVINRYYTNFFKDEGYLTFTLPVTTSSLYNAKIIGGATMLIASAIISICGFTLTLMILTGNNESFLNWELLKDIFDGIKMVFNIEFTLTEVLFIIEVIVYMIIESVSVLILIYLAITISCTRFNKRRVLIGIAIYYGFNIGKNIINTIILSIFRGFSFVEDSSMSSFEDVSIASVYMLIMIFVSITIAIFAYSYNRKILSTKLNLD